MERMLLNLVVCHFLSSVAISTKVLHVFCSWNINVCCIPLLIYFQNKGASLMEYYCLKNWSCCSYYCSLKCLQLIVMHWYILIWGNKWLYHLLVLLIFPNLRACYLAMMGRIPEGRDWVNLCLTISSLISKLAARVVSSWRKVDGFPVYEFDAWRFSNFSAFVCSYLTFPIVFNSS